MEPVGASLAGCVSTDDEAQERLRTLLHVRESREWAELKRDQLHAYGQDRRITRCAGSKSATDEPAAE